MLSFEPGERNLIPLMYTYKLLLAEPTEKNGMGSNCIVWRVLSEGLCYVRGQLVIIMYL